MRTITSKTLAIAILLIITGFASGYASAEEGYCPPQFVPKEASVAVSETAKKLAIEINGGFAQIAGTGSMAPTLMAGDFIVYAPVKYTDVKVGDLISFTAQMAGARFNQVSLFTHRVVIVDKFNRLWTKGDANKAMDSEPVWGKYDLKGRVAFIINGKTGEVQDLRPATVSASNK